MSAEKAAREQNLEVVGWYHSHPDHPARPERVRPRSRLAVVQLHHRQRAKRRAAEHDFLAPER